MFTRFILIFTLLFSLTETSSFSAPKSKISKNKNSKSTQEVTLEKDVNKPSPTEAKNPYSSLPLDIEILASQALVMDAQTEEDNYTWLREVIPYLYIPGHPEHRDA